MNNVEGVLVSGFSATAARLHINHGGMTTSLEFQPASGLEGEFLMGGQQVVNKQNKIQ